jgi:hypothetical protein
VSPRLTVCLLSATVLCSDLLASARADASSDGSGHFTYFRTTGALWAGKIDSAVFP